MRALLYQALICAPLSAIFPVAAPLLSSILLYRAGEWAVLPLIGALTAYRATRRGVSPYLAWLQPAIWQTALHWLILAYPPESPLMPILTALVSLIAAATASVVNERAGASGRNGKQ